MRYINAKIPFHFIVSHMQGLHIPHSNTIIKTATLNDWNMKNLYKFCNRKVATFFLLIPFCENFPEL